MPEQFWVFCDYVDHRGINVVLEGLRALGPGDKAKMNEFIRQLERTKSFDRKDVKALKNIDGEKGKGLHELRYKLSNVQQRPLGILGPKKHALEAKYEKPLFTILVMAKEMNSRFVPPGAVQMCWNALEKIKNGQATIVPHDFS